MIPLDEMTDEQFGELARSILARELGPEGLVRSLSLVGDSDFTRDRHLWQDGITMDEILADCQNQSEAAAS